MKVLSLFDGMSCGMIAFTNSDFCVEEYTAYEIDEYAMKVAMKNYPDIIQCGDAFKVREENWVY